MPPTSPRPRLPLPARTGTIAVIDAQFGDTGKGKFVDLFADWADIVARGTGGANAGHTIYVGDKEFVFHLLPSGILKKHTVNIIGRGVAFDPAVVAHELTLLKKTRRASGKLRIAYNAPVVMPQHILLDRVREHLAGQGKIGTTGRGIGPLYEDQVRRVGITVNDLLNKDLLRAKLTRNLSEKLLYFKLADKTLLRELLHMPLLGSGAFFHPRTLLNVESLIDAYTVYGNAFREFVDDTDSYLRGQHGKKKILLEGAQGVMLSVDYGTYPYVTASDSSAIGLARGVGLHPKDISATYALIKGFYMTRVGEGPFPTELGGSMSARWCGDGEVNKENEFSRVPEASPNHHDPFIQGVGLRIAGGEYGATTGRPRRVGWLDLPLLRYALQFGGTSLILTKLDVLDDCEEIKVCTEYIYRGPRVAVGQIKLTPGKKLFTAIPAAEILTHCEPVLKKFPGWRQRLRACRRAGALPRELRQLIQFLERQVGTHASLVSVGPRPEETVVL